jgi:hypothetical protein
VARTIKLDRELWNMFSIGYDKIEMRHQRIMAKLASEPFNIDDISNTNFAVHLCAVAISNRFKLFVNPLLSIVMQLVEACHEDLHERLCAQEGGDRDQARAAFGDDEPR